MVARQHNQQTAEGTVGLDEANLIMKVTTDVALAARVQRLDLETNARLPRHRRSVRACDVRVRRATLRS
jgi:hypothetical protein